MITNTGTSKIVITKITGKIMGKIQNEFSSVQIFPTLSPGRISFIYCQGDSGNEKLISASI